MLDEVIVGLDSAVVLLLPCTSPFRLRAPVRLDDSAVGFGFFSFPDLGSDLEVWDDESPVRFGGGSAFRRATPT